MMCSTFRWFSFPRAQTVATRWSPVGACLRLRPSGEAVRRRFGILHFREEIDRGGRRLFASARKYVDGGGGEPPIASGRASSAGGDAIRRAVAASTAALAGVGGGWDRGPCRNDRVMTRVGPRSGRRWSRSV